MHRPARLLTEKTEVMKLKAPQGTAVITNGVQK